MVRPFEATALPAGAPAIAPWWSRTVLIAGLQLAVGAFLVVAGAQLLVAPHRVPPATFALLQPRLPLWALACLVAGAALIAVGALDLSASLRVRLALAFIAAAGVPSMVGTTIIADQAERVAIDQALADQAALAAS